MSQTKEKDGRATGGRKRAEEILRRAGKAREMLKMQGGQEEQEKFQQQEQKHSRLLSTATISAYKPGYCQNVQPVG